MASSNKNNILAGGFLIAALALAVGSSFIIKGVNLEHRTEYEVYFPMGVGASGLQPGSAVNLGGRQVGEVASLHFYTTADAARIGLEGLIDPGSEVPESSAVQLDSGGPERLAGIRVAVRIASGVVLFDNAQVFLEKQLLGSGSELNIASVGNPAAPGFRVVGPSERLEAGETIVGRVAAPAFLRDAGLGPTEQKLISETVKRVHRIVSNVDDLVVANQGKVGPAVDDLAYTLSEFRKTGQRVDQWNGQVDTILDNTVGFTERFNPFVENANAGIEEARGTIRSVQAAMDTNRPKLDATMDNVLAASANLNERVIPNANDAVERGKELMARLDGLIAENAPAIRRIMANGRLAADQLKLATLEVRSQPWRLLYQPTTKETDQQLLYDSARSYATAVSDLRAASESLEAVLAAREAGAGSLRPDEIQRLIDDLSTAFSRYEQTEQNLLDRMIKQDK